MTDLQIFQNEQFGTVRTITENGRTLFCGADVAKALGYARPKDAIAAHTKGAVKRRTLTNGGMQEMTFIPEGDIYRLTARSNLPSADEFERWIFDEVLPTMRKTGGYVANDDAFIDTYLPYADEQTKILFRSTLETVKRLNEKVKADTPKVEYFDRAVERGDNLSFRDTAKVLGVSQSTLINFLGINHYIYRDQKGRLRPYSQYEQNGLFTVKEFERETNGYSSVQTLVTFKGRDYFSKKISSAKNAQ
mgnify:FL=1